uniref:Uncharacterized protein n=1 Tax=Oryza meridionalis TaxID=40149 RepID=A0A0E0F7T2_9ORYZ
MAIPRTKACDGIGGQAAEATLAALSPSPWASWEWAGWRRLVAVREEAKSGEIGCADARDDGRGSGRDYRVGDLLQTKWIEAEQWQ